MKILYISSTYVGIHTKGIYSDLTKKLSEDHDVTVAYAKESRLNEDTKLYTKDGITYLGIKTPNMSKNKNLIKKGIATLLFDDIFKHHLKKHLKEPFDLVLYSTPPVNLTKTLKLLKKTSPKAFFYLMLKDSFPQNAIDLNLIKENSFLHKYFKNKERVLYDLSDFIGVMSEANRSFVLDYYPNLKEKLEILPNTITIEPRSHAFTRSDYGLPEDKVLLLYGGNLGLPQAVPFIIECYETIKDADDVALVISGSGAKDQLVKDYIAEHKPKNLYYFDYMPQEKYSALTSLCDVGLIFLDYRFIVPNFPQRLLSYIENRLPVVCATDPNTDVGTIAEANGFGYYVPSNTTTDWLERINTLTSKPELRKAMGNKGYQFLEDHYTTDKAVTTILAHIK